MIDDVNTELDKRKVIKVVTPEELQNAPIITIVRGCDCPGEWLDDSTKILKCPACGQPGVEE